MMVGSKTAIKRSKLIPGELLQEPRLPALVYINVNSSIMTPRPEKCCVVFSRD